jgi:hypothetical protein
MQTPTAGSEEMHLGGDEFNMPPTSAPPGDGEFKWDLPNSGGDGNGEEGGVGGIGGLLVAIWAFISGGD